MIRLARRMCAPGPSQHRWRDELVALMRAHLAAERDELLAEPVVNRLGVGPVDPDAAALDQLAVDIEASDLTAADVGQLCARVQRVLEAHAAALRSNVLDCLEGEVARKELRRLGGCYVARRDAEMSRGSAGAPPRTLDRSRAELYEMARRVGIQGRSSMTRTQLINALRRQAHS